MYNFDMFFTIELFNILIKEKMCFGLIEADISHIWPELNQTFSPEIDEEANSYFQQIYNQPPNPIMSVDDVLQMLKRFKDSQVQRERVSNFSYLMLTLAEGPVSYSLPFPSLFNHLLESLEMVEYITVRMAYCR